MATTTWRTPNVAAQAQIDGTSFAWTSINNVKLVDGSEATGFSTAAGHIIVSARLYKTGAQIGTNQASNNAVNSNSGFGGSSNLWGATPSAADVNASDFGVSLCYGHTDGGNIPFAQNIIVTDFGFGAEIPSNAVITGVEIEITDDSRPIGGGLQRVFVDGIRMRITYSVTAELSAEGHSHGAIYREPITSGDPEKIFRHRVYDPKTKQFIAEWTDVESDPKFKQDINSLGSAMELEFARTDLSVSKKVEILQLEQNTEELTTEDDEPLGVDLVERKGIGEGTDLDLNYDYEATAFYGGFEELATEDGEPIVTESYEPIVVAEGRPEGQRIFTGYISKWDALFNNGKNNIKANILSHAQELKNLIYETADTIVVNNNSSLSGEVEFGICQAAKASVTDRTEIAQSITAVGNDSIPRFVIQAKRYGTINDTSFPSITMTLIAGAPNGGGSPIYSVTKQITNLDYENIVFSLPENYAVVNASVYSIVFTTESGKVGGADSPYRVYIRGNTSVYGGGGAYERINNGSSSAISNQDIMFEMWEAGGLTTVTHNSTDPAVMLKAALDFAASRGSRVTYSDETIEATDSVASYVFNTMTIAEVIDKCLELAPKDWYYWFDVATNELHFHPRPTTPTRTIMLGRDIVDLKISRTIEKLVNDVYYSGGGDPAVFARVTDGLAIEEWRRAMAKFSDQRVEILATAQLLAQAEIDRYGQPIYSGSGTILPVEFYIEDMMLGELLAFTGSGSFLDDLQLQLVSRTYQPDTLPIELETLLPKTQKRIEEIRRNLQAIEHENNPTSPS
jgi:hypothetical protein